MHKKIDSNVGEENLLICVDESNEFSSALKYAC